MQAQFITSATSVHELPPSPLPHIATVGRSNVGKSSLINHLAGQRKLANVSSGPGRTRTLNMYNFSNKYALIDLPGYGYAKTSKDNRAAFSEMIFEFLQESEQLKLALAIIDARISLSPLDDHMISWMVEENVPFCIVLNKMDKVKMTEAQKLHRLLEDKFPGVQRIEHSIHSGKGQKAIIGAIESAIRTETVFENPLA